MWLQSYVAQHSVLTWPELCVAVEQKFWQDLHRNYMRDLLAIRQTSDVLEYVGRFEQAKHRVLMHNKDMGDVFFVQEFLDGLKYNISNAITLHKPRTIDVTLSLALMQEELWGASNKRFSNRAQDYSGVLSGIHLHCLQGHVAHKVQTSHPIQWPPSQNGTTSYQRFRLREGRWGCAPNVETSGPRITHVLLRSLCTSWRKFWML